MALVGTCKLTGGLRLLDFPSLLWGGHQPWQQKHHRERRAHWGQRVILAANSSTMWSPRNNQRLRIKKLSLLSSY